MWDFKSFVMFVLGAQSFLPVMVLFRVIVNAVALIAVFRLRLKTALNLVLCCQIAGGGSRFLLKLSMMIQKGFNYG